MKNRSIYCFMREKQQYIDIVQYLAPKRVLSKNIIDNRENMGKQNQPSTTEKKRGLSIYVVYVKGFPRILNTLTTRGIQFQ